MFMKQDTKKKMHDAIDNFKQRLEQPPNDTRSKQTNARSKKYNAIARILQDKINTVEKIYGNKKNRGDDKSRTNRLLHK